jgi:tyrosine-protein kinase Etk/Wzc
MSTSTIKKEEKEVNILSVLIFRFMPYWPLFILLFVLFGFGAWLYIRYAKPMYEDYATILIKDEKKGVDDSKMLETLNFYTSKKIVENEMVIIKSRALMKEVVEKLKLYAPIYEQGRIKNVIAYNSSPITIEAQQPDSLKASGEVPFTFNRDKRTVVINKENYKLNEWISTPYGILKFTENLKANIAPSTPLYFTIMNPEGVASTLSSRLSIMPANKISTVLQLTLADESPVRAKEILDELTEVYAKSTINEKNALAANTLSFIEERLKYVEKDLNSIEKSIQQYKSQKGIVDLSEQGKVFLQNVSNNDRQSANINMQLAVLDQVEQYVVSKNNKTGIVPATLGLEDNVLTQLLDKLYNAEIEYEKLRQTMAENNPAVVAIAGEIENIRPAILENVRNQRTSLQASLDNLKLTNGIYTSMLKTIPQKERELLEISRQQTIKNSVYSFLLQKREETALSSSSTIADSRLIDKAIASYTPVSPKKFIVYLGALVLAFITAIFIVISKEILTNKILFRSDIEGYTQIPIAAEIASVKHKQELVINQPDNVYVSEQFRHLRAAIGLYGKVASKQKILITSSIAGEGKSFVAANLALSIAMSGKKVVLLDADLRGPKTSIIFGIEDKAGLSEYLEENASVGEILIDSGNKNLYVISAGGPCNNPTELLLNGKLDKLFTHLENQFDYIIIDTSPTDPVTDAFVLSEYCDKTLFVVRHGYTPKTMVQLLDENNKIKALHNPSIVFNGVKKRGFLNGSYGFGYGFGYEYVYKDREGFKKNRKRTLFK